MPVPSPCERHTHRVAVVSFLFGSVMFTYRHTQTERRTLSSTASHPRNPSGEMNTEYSSSCSAVQLLVGLINPIVSLSCVVFFARNALAVLSSSLNGSALILADQRLARDLLAPDKRLTVRRRRSWGCAGTMPSCRGWCRDSELWELIYNPSVPNDVHSDDTCWQSCRDNSMKNPRGGKVSKRDDSGGELQTCSVYSRRNSRIWCCSKRRHALAEQLVLVSFLASGPKG